MTASPFSCIRPFGKPQITSSRVPSAWKVFSVAAFALAFAIGTVKAEALVGSKDTQTEAQSDQESKPAKPAKSEKVCRREEVTGSRFSKRVCHTPEQWEARERAAREMGREIDAKSVGKTSEG